jgi:mycofactocin system glycosyltransferase
MPAGLRVVPDIDTIAVDVESLIGGTPRRVVRLSAAGLGAWTELCRGPVTSAAAGVLARRLTDAGLAHPQPRATRDVADVTVVIPVRDRPEMLERCLAAIGGRYRVVVVDDGSLDPGRAASIVDRHHAALCRSSIVGGPAMARNHGLQGITTDLVAFVDSDCIPPADWIDRLAAHFDDPLVAAVAPRVVAAGPTAGSYLAACGALDLGDRAARVQPGGRVSYVPTAALLLRRSALESVARDGKVFDPVLRYGEDVDLVWRLHASGWRIRYDPSVEVAHHESARWRDRLERRFRYGTSAAPLARRHPGLLTPLVLSPWPAAAVAAILARRPIAAAGALTAAMVATRRSLALAGVADLGAGRVTMTSVARTWLGVGRYALQFASPVLIAVIIAPGGASRPRRLVRRLAVASLVAGPPLSTWMSRRPSVGPINFVAGQIAEDAAYGAGVYAGCLRHRTAAPLRPCIAPPASSTPRQG